MELYSSEATDDATHYLVEYSSRLGVVLVEVEIVCELWRSITDKHRSALALPSGAILEFALPF